MTFKLLKRRYRSTEASEHLRRLDYFNQPFEAGNEIRLLDDIDLPKPLALESLSTTFEPATNKRGDTNAIDRDVKSTKKSVNNEEKLNKFDPFDENNSTNY